VNEKLLDAIEARYEAASPKPWIVVIPRGESLYDRPYIMADGTDVVEGAYLEEWNVEAAGQVHADLEFCAHARTDVPLLVAEVKRLRDKLALMLDARILES